MHGCLLLGEFVLHQNFARAFDDFIREPGQLGDFDSVAAVRGPRFHFAQENDSSAGFFHRHVVVLYTFQLVRQFRQFKIVGCEQSLRSYSGMQILDSRPRDCQSVVGRGAAADLV